MVLFLALPFIIFWWLCPFITDTTIGNDYQVHPIPQQMELMYNIKTGSFPLFIPGFALGGSSSSTLTLGQLFHPISYIATMLPGYWKGYATEWNTFLRLITLGIAHLVLFSFLKKIRIGLIVSFYLSTLTLYNLRMLDLFRFGASLESWTGHIFLCSAIGFSWITPNRFSTKFFIIGATYWLVCSGHPQMMYFGFLGAVGFTFVVPYFVNLMMSEKQPAFKTVFKFWIQVGFYCAIGIFLSSAYILPFYCDAIPDLATIRSFVPDYLWADGFRDTFTGTLNNFFYPLRSDLHGAFGGTSVILFSLLIPLLPLLRIRVPKIIWIIWGWGLLVFLCMQGDRTPVHYLMWKYFPGANPIRIAGRISIIMPVIIMMITAWILNKQTVILIPHNNIFRITALFLLPILLIGGYLLLPESLTLDIAPFSPVLFRHIPTWFATCYFALGIVTFIVMFFNGIFPKYRKIAETIICFMICFQIIGVMQYGTWVEQKKITPTFEEIKARKQKTISYERFGYEPSQILQKQIKLACIEPFLGRLYSEYVVAKNNDQAYDIIAQKRSQNSIVVEKYSSEPTLFFKKESTSNKKFHGLLKLQYNSANRLVFDTNTSDTAFFLFAFPYTGHWKASINESNVPVYRANGAYHAVQIPAGQNQVEFRYWSRSAFIGIIISLLTLIVTVSYISLKFFPKSFFILSVTTSIFLGLILFYVWKTSLYTGENYNFKFKWESDIAKKSLNIAYGKPTWMSSLADNKRPHICNACRAVDGNRSPITGSCTAREMEPYWIVDLNKRSIIDTIIIYDGASIYPKVNTRPLFVLTSLDGEQWSRMRIDTTNNIGKITLKYNQSTPIRYIKISASGTCQLSLDEVEVYPIDNE